MMKKWMNLLLLLVCLQAGAQQQKMTFTGTVQAGILEGETGTEPQLKATGGVQHKSWTASLGAGLDYYHTRSIPVFLDLRKSFGKSGKAPFLYANGGYHFPWLQSSRKNGWSTVDATGGLYVDAGIGYQVPASKNTQLFFTLGYSQKNFREKYTDGVVIAIWPPIPPYTRTADYTLRRLSFQTGFRF